MDITFLGLPHQCVPPSLSVPGGMMTKHTAQYSVLSNQYTQCSTDWLFPNICFLPRYERRLEATLRTLYITFYPARSPPRLLRLDPVPCLPPSCLCWSFQRRHNGLNWTQNGKKTEAEENGKNINAFTASVAIEKELWCPLKLPSLPAQIWTIFKYCRNKGRVKVEAPVLEAICSLIWTHFHSPPFTRIRWRR